MERGGPSLLTDKQIKRSAKILHLQIPFAKGFQELDIDEQNLIMLAEPPLKMEAAADEGEELKRGFAHPIGTPRLRELARKGQKVAIAVSDYTRSTPQRESCLSYWVSSLARRFQMTISRLFLPAAIIARPTNKKQRLFWASTTTGSRSG